MGSRRMRRIGATAGVLALLGWSIGAATPVRAATVPAYATWTFAGTGGAYTGTVTLAPGYPVAAFTSTSRSGSVGPQSGAATWLPAGSPIGAVFGSSANREYLNLRPAADNVGAPSTTTYTFAEPIPAGSWAFAVGDIDADRVTVAATDTDGNPVAVGGLGFQGSFNYCDATPRASTCSGVVAPYDLPVWDPATATLVGNVANTSGASGWFRPTVALSSLTLTFTYVSGQPVYQTWFAALTRSITGSVTLDAAPRGGVELVLTGLDGTALATTTTDADGTYAFDGFAAVAGYTVTMTTPDGLEPIGTTSRPADLSTADAVADFALGTPAPATFPVSGVVTDADNNPVGGATVTLTDAGSAPVASTTTDAAGRYTFTEVPAGTYTLNVAPTPMFQGATTRIEVPLAGGEVAPIVVAAVPPTVPPTAPPTALPTLPATGRDTAGPTTLLALAVLAGGIALASAARRTSPR